MQNIYVFYVFFSYMDFIVIVDILPNFFEILITPVKKMKSTPCSSPIPVLDFSSLCDVLAAVCALLIFLDKGNLPHTPRVDGYNQSYIKE